jgi:hypothetical protein
MIDVTDYNSKVKHVAKIVAKVNRTSIEDGMEFMTGGRNVEDALKNDKLKIMDQLSITEQELSNLTVKENEHYFDELMNLYDEELPWLIENIDRDDLSDEQLRLIDEYAIFVECSNIDGYSSLKREKREKFLRTYKRHQACIGTDYKNKWRATSVHDFSSYLRVEFVNKEWLHYLPDGTWG